MMASASVSSSLLPCPTHLLSSHTTLFPRTPSHVLAFQPHDSSPWNCLFPSSGKTSAHCTGQLTCPRSRDHGPKLSQQPWWLFLVAFMELSEKSSFTSLSCSANLASREQRPGSSWSSIDLCILDAQRRAWHTLGTINSSSNSPGPVEDTKMEITCLCLFWVFRSVETASYECK